MAVNNELKPFPIELYKDLRIIGDNFVIQNNNLIGHLDFPEIIPVRDLELEDEDVEMMLKQGIKIDRFYKDYYINEKGIPVENVNVPGYPDGTITRDVFGLIYYKNICVGSFHSYRGIIIDFDNEDKKRLDDLGIEYSFLWGSTSVNPIVDTPKAPSVSVFDLYAQHKSIPPDPSYQPELIVVPYDTSKGWYRETTHNGIVKIDVEGNITLVGMYKCSNPYGLGQIFDPTEEEKQCYIEMGVKIE